jgi:hypothetical protein
MKAALVLAATLLAVNVNQAPADDSHSNNITVLDPNTFLRVDLSNEGSEIIQLFKVENNEIFLVDALQIMEKKVNFKPLLEYRKLKIEKNN